MNFYLGDVLIENLDAMEKYFRLAVSSHPYIKKRMMSKDLVPATIFNFMVSMYNFLLEIDERPSPFENTSK